MTTTAAAPRRPGSWLTPAVVLLLLISIGSGVAWRMQLSTLDAQIQRKRAALKNLHLAGRIPPNREVMEYLQTRAAGLETQYQAGLKAVAMMPLEIAGQADPQLFFQQRVHEVQMALSRLATARSLPAPTLLGLPKELPPADVAPRFLLQLSLIQEAAELILTAPGITQLSAFKVEDPEPVALTPDPADSFLSRLPVRVRLSGSLTAMTTVLGILDRARPVIDVQSVKLVVPDEPAAPAPAMPSNTTGITSPSASAMTPPKPVAAAPPAVNAGPRDVEAELVIARYLITAPRLEAPELDASPAPSGKRPAAKK